MILVDFSDHVVNAWNKESHLHKLKPLPDPNGNRAERREAKKREKKNAK